MIEQLERESTQQEAEQEELESKLKESEQDTLTLNKKVSELNDQVKLALKEKEDVGQKAGQLEEKVHKMELLVDQTNLTKNQMSKQVDYSNSRILEQEQALADLQNKIKQN